MGKKAKRRAERAAWSQLPSRSGALPPLRHAVARTPATSWPVADCWISSGWGQPGQLVQILVTRVDPESGALVSASFLVDLGCLGVKNCDVKRFTSREVFMATLFELFEELQPMEPIDVNTAAKIIREGVGYAASLGFKPNRDYQLVAAYLAGADPDASPVEVPLGEDGKPLFINGPYDDVDRIVSQLERAVGPGNFHIMLFSGPL